TIGIWPEFLLSSCQDTYATLHRWTQIVGHILMALTPLINHWWNVTLYVSARGLTTSPIPYQGRSFEIRFDFIDHEVIVETTDGETKHMHLVARPVADFYRELLGILASLDIQVKIHAKPDEVPDPIPFAQDYKQSC